MSMVESQPGLPRLIEVISAESAENLVADVMAELAMLEEELVRLDAEAASLERSVALAGPGSRDDGLAVPILRQVFESQMAATRAAMAAALEAAITEAEAMVAETRAAAEAMVPELGSRWAPEPRDVTLDPLPADEADHHDEQEQPRPIAFVEPPHVGVPEAGFGAITTVMPVIAADDPNADDPNTGEFVGDASTAFGEFWVDGRADGPARHTGTGLIDVALPLVALLIIVVVLLSWLG